MRKYSYILAFLLLWSSLPNNVAMASDEDSRYFEIAKNIEIFTTLYKELNSLYVDDIDPSKFMQSGIYEMLEKLDPYTNFITGADIDEYQLQTTGKYGGIGARINTINGNVIITDPYENAPAHKAGIMAGDQILEIDGQVLNEKNSDEVSQLLRGQPGTKLVIKVKRAITNEELTFNIKREEINISNVPYYGIIKDNIGYIKLDQFTDEAGKNVSDALKALEGNNTLQGVILDLRGNPGGLLDEAINVCNVFIDKDVEITSTKGKVPEANAVYYTKNKAIDATIPLVVLTDGGSASASEIVSGSMQDLDRGVIIGQRTFGKGLVQITRPIAYKSKLKLTISKYYIPSGRCIQAIDYSNRDSRGNALTIPDSLRHTFKTKAGRIVKDGAGIEPDIATKEELYAPISLALVTNSHMFNYATLYKSKHPSISDIKNFSLSDAEYDDFVTFLKDKAYDYTTETEGLLKDLKASVKEEEYSQNVKASITELEDQINHDKDKDLIKYKSQIIKLLESEIASRYAYEKGRIEVTLKNDTEIKKALEILSSPSEYKKLLSVQAQ